MMKKFFMPIFAALALTGCSDDDPGSGNGNETPENSGGHFLAVNIVSQGGGTASRAGESADANGPSDVYGNTFEDGTTTENAVKAVRLYFFTATGDAVSIKKNVSVNYYDIPTDQIATDNPSEDHGQTVERILQAVVVVEPGERLPAKIAAVINPIFEGANALGNGTLSLSDLQNRCINYADYANAKVADSKGNYAPQFVMSNSIYADANGLVDATPVSAVNYAATPDAAKQSPVEIYVERTVGKVRVDATGVKNEKLTAPDGVTILYKLKRAIRDEYGNIIGEEDLKIAEKQPESAIPDGSGANAYEMTQVYLRLDAWDVTADVSHAWFFKHVDMNWQRNKLGSDIVWNDPANHRSYWADVCNPQGVNRNLYYAYNDANHFKSTLFDGVEGTYCNENAERSGDSGLTNPKVLIKGTICDESGAPLMISEYGGNRFIDDSSLLGLKNRYIEMLKGMRSELPWREGTPDKNGNKTYIQLSEADLDLRPIEYINPSDIDENKASANAVDNKYTYDKGRYYVYPCLNEQASKYTWYKTVRYGEKEGTYELGPVEDVAAINKYMLKLSHAMVWKNGKTYYFVDIKHLGNIASGNWGIVRNHIYDIELENIYGIGTPVYGDELVVEPEKPENDETFIAARVRILSWRVVSQKVNLDWD